MFVRNYGRFAKKHKIALPWILPRNFGGVGIHPFGKWKVGEKDCQMAHFLFRDRVRFPIVASTSAWQFEKVWMDFCDGLGIHKIESRDRPGYDLFTEFLLHSQVNERSRKDLHGQVIWKDPTPNPNMKPPNPILPIRRAERLHKKYMRLINGHDRIDPWEFQDVNFEYDVRVS
jgi:hypothetical protein